MPEQPTPATTAALVIVDDYPAEGCGAAIGVRQPDGWILMDDGDRYWPRDLADAYPRCDWWTGAGLILLRSLRDAVEDELDIYTRPKVRAALAALQEHERREGGTDARQ